MKYSYLLSTLRDVAGLTRAEWLTIVETGNVPISWALRACKTVYRLEEERDEYQRRWGEAVDLGVRYAQTSAANILHAIMAGAFDKPQPSTETGSDSGNPTGPTDTRE